MLDGEALDQVVAKHKPDLIVPEIEAIRTERFYDYEKQGIQVVPSAKAANFTMNRKAIRDLAATELGLKTAPFAYATTIEELRVAGTQIGYPCVVKPLMSSSGKGQSVVRSEADIETAWKIATGKGRGDVNEVIIEGFIDFNSEITLLTVTQQNGPTRFCPPIGHRQERGDYMESWQPAAIGDTQLQEAQEMAASVTATLGGAGIWGVEFFLTRDAVYFSELSPRPHDTGMVTLAGTQPFNEFELHLRAVLGLPISEIPLLKAGASAVVLAPDERDDVVVEGLADAAAIPHSDFRIFAKPTTRQFRRMGVGLAYDAGGESLESIRGRAKQVADTLRINP